LGFTVKSNIRQRFKKVEASLDLRRRIKIKKIRRRKTKK
jgi:hypothetical protein